MKTVQRLLSCSILTLIAVGLVALQPAMAKRGYPKKPIKLIVCYSPGGDADLTARVWADFAEKELGQPVIVVNKTGGGGVAGTTFAAHAKADGYTLFLAQAGAVLIAPQTAKTSYGVDSFEYISRIMIGNCGLIAHKDAPWKNLADFVKDAKAAPGKYIYASPGAATWLTLAMRHWEIDADLDLKHVEHQGSAPAVTSLLGKHTDVSFVFPQSYIPQVKSGNVKLLALGQKSDQFPGVPSFEELGYQGSYIGWGGIAAPKGTSKEVMARIAAATRTMVKNPAFIKAMDNIHATPSYLGPEEWSPVVRQQYQDLSKVIDKLGIRAN
ncbi:Bug family tripartite tricarboxylate transporter substrate binding protein [Desulfogranum mediterraneum]|uniref:Bug family tripartite tricarboxylate transporter substrate binding protein n=1 Tax=Desulfogranum mediterraneum TaxID=160661 RepID=UPI0003F54D9B|nr:tripartite tricarboxylate transporter substrate binding protein [Desulfogranum mediterraneum]